jgi:hypothetical protein
MKKRILSLLLAILMVITVVPTISLADKSSTDVKYSEIGGYIYFDKYTGTVTDCDSAVTGVLVPQKIDGVTVTSIGDDAFLMCVNIAYAILPTTLKSIEAGAFCGCSKMEWIDIPSNVTSIGTAAFRYCHGLKEITIPGSVKKITGYTFWSCHGLETVTFLNGVIEIGIGMFADCTNLKNVVMPVSVARIGAYSFKDCTSLTSISIPEYVIQIGTGAFSGCTKLTDVYYAGSQEQWNNIYIGEENDNLKNATIHFAKESHTHSYTSVVTDPTCAAKGYTTYTCSCGDSYVDNYTNALGHNYSNGKCTRCGAADPNYKAPTAVTFSDVAAKAYYSDAVQWAIKNNITNGTDDTHFSPNQGCTRGQVVTFLWRAAGSPTVSGDAGFVDVKSTDYYYDAVKWAVANGITNGTDATHFSPSATCTRGQVVTFMYRAEGSPATSGSCGFVDVKSADYYYNAVIWAVANGITNGTDATHFSPSATCTRAQVVTFLHRNAQK